jgi:hypothetical protein
LIQDLATAHQHEAQVTLLSLFPSFQRHDHGNQHRQQQQPSFANIEENLENGKDLASHLVVAYLRILLPVLRLDLVNRFLQVCFDLGQQTTRDYSSSLAIIPRHQVLLGQQSTLYRRLFG